MSDEKIFIANSEKYPELIGPKLDMSKGIFILVKHDQVIAQGENSFTLIETIMNDKSNVGDDIQLANLLCIQANRHFQQYLHCINYGLGLTTSSISVRYIGYNGIELNDNHQFLIDTGASMTCIPEFLNPYRIPGIFIDEETGGGVKRQHVTSIKLIIDEYSYNLVVCITQAQTCILEVDVL